MKTLMNGIVVMMMVVATTAAQAQVKAISFAQLPKNAQSFISKHYSEKNVSYITEESEFLSSAEYEVRLKDGKEIDFDSKGQWKEVDGKKKAIPAAIIPAPVVAYVKKSFPENDIVKISRSSRRYEIELSNGLDLEFDKKGNFLRIDD
ncbi:hypothetical protein G5B30_13800 [Sphingobacterium sp. SGG-5]|uniref:PepSY-like domain-containing protein n=1 Tax=Sphingobacterium sp. SGG-5 TaxID=2710881 RepID=UPI0013EB6018|nr:PepSY-like domain-containing protein [Sphingobacterium sp. SGG-5]NGM62981.1 hypothetical protein [Sphingobacterium sp. SGG-5]